MTEQEIKAGINFENELINQRLTWFGALQGLLIAALAFAWKDAAAVVPIIGVLGALVALSIGAGTRRANKAIDRLEQELASRHIELIGISNRERYSWLMPGVFLPWVFGIGWPVIVLVWWLSPK